MNPKQQSSVLKRAYDFERKYETYKGPLRTLSCMVYYGGVPINPDTGSVDDPVTYLQELRRIEEDLEPLKNRARLAAKKAADDNELVTAQGNVSYQEASRALKASGGDVVNAIVALCPIKFGRSACIQELKAQKAQLESNNKMRAQCIKPHKEFKWDIEALEKECARKIEALNEQLEALDETDPRYEYLNQLRQEDEAALEASNWNMWKAALKAP